MQIQADTLEKKPRLYAVEFLRIFFVFFIIFGHIMQMYPDIKSSVYNFLNSDLVPTWFCVEYYSIIGGFFIYRNCLKNKNLFDSIKHVYMRLFPAVFFLYLIALINGLARIHMLPIILTMTQGISIPIADAIGWGDWFAGAYFWASCFCISLLFYLKDKAFMFMIPLIYVLLVTQHHTTYPGWMKAYYGLIGSEFLRVLYCVCLGALASFGAQNLTLPKDKFARFLFTVLEVILLYFCFRRIFYGNSVISMVAITSFSLLLILIANSAGIISSTLNKISQIHYLSRYSWGIFIGHAYWLTFFQDRGSKLCFDDATCGLLSVGGAILIGIFEYHIVEKRVVPWVCKYFQGDKQ